MNAVDRDGQRGRVAVICGDGALPGEVVAAARSDGRDPFIIAIHGEADRDVDTAGDALWMGWGQIGRMFKEIKKAGARDVVLIGGVTQRPDFLSTLSDMGTVRRIPRILQVLKRGDDGVLKGIISMFEEEGLRIVGAHEIAPSLLAGPGVSGQHEPSAENTRDLALAIKAARMLGVLDIGQAAVAVNGRVIALEAAEGTDAMLQRCIDLKGARRVRWKGAAGVLVKCVKPGQDLRVDLPAIGPQTVAQASELGLAGIAIDAGHVLIANRAATIAAADTAGLFISGVVDDADGVEHG